MKKYEFELRVCRAETTTYTKDLHLTLPEAKKLFFNIVGNDPSVIMCEIYWRSNGNIYDLFTYNNHNGLAKNKKRFNDEEEEKAENDGRYDEEYEDICRMWLNSEGQLYQDMGD